MKGVASLMKSQLNLVRQARNGMPDVEVRVVTAQVRLACWHLLKKVVLIGGFAGSEALRDYLKKKLEKINSKHNSHIELITPTIRWDSSFELSYLYDWSYIIEMALESRLLQELSSLLWIRGMALLGFFDPAMESSVEKYMMTIFLVM